MTTRLSRRTLRLPRELDQRVRRFADERQISLNTVCCSAIEQFFAEKDEMDGGAILRSVGGVSQKIRGLKRDMELLGELWSFFVFQWCCYTPPLPESQRAAMLLEGQERHRKFLVKLKERLGRGSGDLADLLQSVDDEPTTPPTYTPTDGG